MFLTICTAIAFLVFAASLFLRQKNMSKLKSLLTGNESTLALNYFQLRKILKSSSAPEIVSLAKKCVRYGLCYSLTLFVLILLYIFEMFGPK